MHGKSPCDQPCNQPCDCPCDLHFDQPSYASLQIQSIKTHYWKENFGKMEQENFGKKKWHKGIWWNFVFRDFLLQKFWKIVK